MGRDGKSMNKDNSFMYQAKYIDGDTVDDWSQPISVDQCDNISTVQASGSE